MLLLLLVLVLLSLALSIDRPQNARALVVSFSSDDLALLLIGGIVLVIARVMEEAARIADENAAGGEIFEAGNHTQGAGLATTGRTKQDNKRLVGDFQGEAKDGRDFLAAATAVDFGDVLKGDAGHGAGRVARFMGAGERRDAVNDDWCGPRRQGRGLRQNRVWTWT